MNEVMVIERLGRFHRVLNAGLHFTIPWIESPCMINWRCLEVQNNQALATVKHTLSDRVDLREHVLDFGHQTVITKDTVSIDVDALCYFRIGDARFAVYQIAQLPDALELLVQTTLRDIIANMSLDDTFSSRDHISAELLSRIRADAERWGVSVTRVEIFGINPPRDIAQAMEQQIKAERERRGMVLEADGTRSSGIISSRGEAARMVLSAEGYRTSKLNEAKGQATAKEHIARAEAHNIRAVSSEIQAADGDKACAATDYLAAVSYLNSLASLFNQNQGSVVMVPTGAVDKLDGIVGQIKAE